MTRREVYFSAPVQQSKPRFLISPATGNTTLDEYTDNISYAKLRADHLAREYGTAVYVYDTKVDEE